MSAITFEPIAGALARIVSLDVMFSRALEGVQAYLAGRKEAALDAATKDFVHHYMLTIGAASELLGAPQFERLQRLHEAIEEELVPDGSAVSPVYDSYSVHHVLGAVPHGLAGETPLSVLARLTRSDASYAVLHELFEDLDEAQPGLEWRQHMAALPPRLIVTVRCLSEVLPKAVASMSQELEKLDTDPPR